MLYSRLGQASRGFVGVILVVFLAPLFAGCDDSTGTAPEMSAAEIQKKQAEEQAARQKAYGKSGVPTGRNPGKNAAKADAAAEKPAEPAAEKPAEKPAP